MPFNPELLGVFMIATTQVGFVDKMLPQSGPPDYAFFSPFGVTKQALDEFVALVSKNGSKATSVALLQNVAALAGKADFYHPAPCPSGGHLAQIVDASKG